MKDASILILYPRGVRVPHALHQTHLVAYANGGRVAMTKENVEKYGIKSAAHLQAVAEGREALPEPKDPKWGVDFLGQSRYFADVRERVGRPPAEQLSRRPEQAKRRAGGGVVRQRGRGRAGERVAAYI